MRRNEIDTILNTILETYEGLSDVNITPGKPFQVEIHGELVGVDILPIQNLTPFQTEVFAINLLKGDQRLIRTLLKRGSCDFSYQLGGGERFRVNIFSRHGSYSIAMRRLPTKIPTFDELGLPEVFNRISKERDGLILVTGATGSGKSSTLAALLERINETKAVHIITLEDPIEFFHPHKRATFNQRELGIDFDSFANGLRAALRQAPKVIMVGEIRDRETMEIAIRAAETGHLVLSTLHTIDAGATIGRISGMVQTENQQLLRIRLADTLRWVVSQRLLPKEGGGRVVAIEVMGNNLRIRELILHGETGEKTFYNIISENTPFGMQTFDQAILDLYKREMISEEVARNYCTSRSVISIGIDRVKRERGEETSEIKDLQMDYGFRWQKR